MNQTPPIIEVADLHKNYGAIQAVRGIDLSIANGCVFGLLGPNGAGKTTTIEIMEDVLKPSQGTVYYKGKPRQKNFSEEVGIQFQATALPDFLTVEETVQTFHALYNRKAEIDWLFDVCFLNEIRTRETTKLSGGQRQRVLLALALVNDPELLFLDEPTTGLDPQARRHLWDIVARIRERGKTVLLTTHYMEEAHALCDQIAIVDAGKIIAEGSPQSLLKKHCAGSTIQLPASSPDLPPTFSWPWKRNPAGIEITTDDVNGSLNALIAAKIDLSDINVHRPTLDDLFLTLTGKGLRD